MLCETCMDSRLNDRMETIVAWIRWYSRNIGETTWILSVNKSLEGMQETYRGLR